MPPMNGVDSAESFPIEHLTGANQESDSESPIQGVRFKEIDLNCSIQRVRFKEFEQFSNPTVSRFHFAY